MVGFFLFFKKKKFFEPGQNKINKEGSCGPESRMPSSAWKKKKKQKIIIVCFGGLF